jgi:hypothetical protein
MKTCFIIYEDYDNGENFLIHWVGQHSSVAQVTFHNKAQEFFDRGPDDVSNIYLASLMNISDEDYSLIRRLVDAELSDNGIEWLNELLTSESPNYICLDVRNGLDS